MAPEQVRILTITDRALEHAQAVKERLAQLNYRVTLDDSQNTLKYKIRNAQMEKVPYMIILCDKDVENNTVSVRHRSGEDLGSITLEEFEKVIGEVVANKLKK
jgi:threonyl-tRNA synthetase